MPLHPERDGLESIVGLLDARAAEHPRHIAFHDRDEGVSLSVLIMESQSIASALARAGVVPGDRVAVWLPNCTAWLATFLACARIGAIVIAVNTRFRSSEVADIVGRASAKVLFYWPGFRQIDFSAILREVDPAQLAGLQTLVAYSEAGEASLPVVGLAGKQLLRYKDLLASETVPTGEIISPDDPCIIFTTSGTTRAPKFVLHSVRTITMHASDVCRAFDLSSAASALILTLPLCGSFGFVQAMAALLAGCSLWTSPAFDVEETIAAIGRHAGTHLIGSDTMFSQLLERTTQTPAFPTLKLCGYGAFSPALPDIGALAERRGIRLRGLYGSSEVQALFSIQDASLALSDRTLGGGRPVSTEANVRARDPESQRILEPGQVGEIEIRTPNRMIGYWGDEAAMRAAITADGYFRTGDSGYTLADGRFVYLDRLNDSLRLGGFLVSPAEIEALILEDADIDACQVVGTSVGKVEKSFAFVIMKSGCALDESRVIARCRARLAAYKVPVRVVALERFPTTLSANATKVQKNELKKMAVEHMGAR